MTTELNILAWGCVLALVHVFAAVRVKTRQYGVEWNMGARDGPVPPPDPIVGRLARAQANFFETFPIAAAAILIAAFSGVDNRLTAIGALVWLGARILYLPLYAFGVRGLRTIAFLAGLVGILMVLWPVLTAELVRPFP